MLGTDRYAIGLTLEILVLAAGTLQTGSEARSQRLNSRLPVTLEMTVILFRDVTPTIFFWPVTKS